ncbi:MAG: SHOCT domain-containing protein, partial [Thermoplasmata archaeon]|nr:SHOCT domain-containing protein [Thermoplasmata archaeon]
RQAYDSARSQEESGHMDDNAYAQGTELPEAREGTPRGEAAQTSMGGTPMTHTAPSTDVPETPAKEPAPISDMERLGTLKELLDRGLITQEEYDEKKEDILKRL